MGRWKVTSSLPEVDKESNYPDFDRILILYMNTMNANRNIDKYNENAEEYSKRIRNKGPVNLIRSIKNYIPQGKILDIACAAGRDSRRLKDLGYEVVGIDLSLKLLSIAKKENPDIIFLEQDATKMEFPKNYFDGILAIGFIHELARKKVMEFVSECFRVLKKDGYILVRTKEGRGEEIAPADSLFSEKRLNTLFLESELNEVFNSNGFTKIKSFVEQSASRKNVKWLVGIYKKN